MVSRITGLDGVIFTVEWRGGIEPDSTSTIARGGFHNIEFEATCGPVNHARDWLETFEVASSRQIPSSNGSARLSVCLDRDVESRDVLGEFHLLTWTGKDRSLVVPLYTFSADVSATFFEVFSPVEDNGWVVLAATDESLGRIVGRSWVAVDANQGRILELEAITNDNTDRVPQPGTGLETDRGELFRGASGQLEFLVKSGTKCFMRLLPDANRPTAQDVADMRVAAASCR